MIKKFIIKSYHYKDLIVILYMIITLSITFFLMYSFFNIVITLLTIIVVTILIFISSVAYLILAETLYDNHQEIIYKLKYGIPK